MDSISPSDPNSRDSAPPTAVVNKLVARESTRSRRSKRAFRIFGTVLGLAITIGLFTYYGTDAVLRPLLHSDPLLLGMLVLLGFVQQSLTSRTVSHGRR